MGAMVPCRSWAAAASAWGAAHPCLAECPWLLLSQKLRGHGGVHALRSGEPGCTLPQQREAAAAERAQPCLYTRPQRNRRMLHLPRCPQEAAAAAAANSADPHSRASWDAAGVARCGGWCAPPAPRRAWPAPPAAPQDRTGCAGGTSDCTAITWVPLASYVLASYVLVQQCLLGLVSVSGFIWPVGAYFEPVLRQS